MRPANLPPTNNDKRRLPPCVPLGAAASAPQFPANDTVDCAATTARATRAAARASATKFFFYILVRQPGADAVYFVIRVGQECSSSFLSICYGVIKLAFPDNTASINRLAK